ncbi:hypothetical protein [Companilactobacillus musae]|uniref:hypothetical protein n=1 Tax=Companilactobacillus musae TaxID=1903258 RepID=UPI000E654C52|nr:hypothetical protein [Companilactobacillus musae]
MRRRHEGFILIEAITSLTIALLVIFTLTLCVNEQFKLLNNWEQRVNAHKIVLLHLKNSQIPEKMTIKGQDYYFSQIKNKYQVRVNKNVYQIQI